MTLRLTMLVDTRGRVPELRTEPGLSLLVEVGAQRWLLDTGSSSAFLANLERLRGPNLGMNGLVLSHGHQDHSGGLPEALHQWPDLEVVAHVAAPQARWSLYQGHPPRPLGMPQASQRALARAHRRPVEGMLELAPGLGVLGPPPAPFPEEARSGPFFLDPEGLEPDPFLDELSLWIDTPEGLVVVLGCCHGGLVGTLDHLLATTGARRLRAVVGGFHLAKAGKGRLAFTAEGLRRLGSPALYPCHCSGAEAAEVLPRVQTTLIAGDVLEL